MQIVKTLNVSDAEFYQVLVDSLVEEVKLFTNDRKLVQGLTYKKPLNTKLSSTIYCDILISKLIDNQVYEYVVINDEDKNIVRFEIKPLADGQCEVTYTEEYQTTDSKKNANNKFMTFIMGFYLKRKVQKKLELIEKSIITRR